MVATTSGLTAGAWLGLAEADATIVGLVVAVVVAFAVAYVIQRVRRSKGDPR